MFAKVRVVTVTKCGLDHEQLTAVLEEARLQTRWWRWWWWGRWWWWWWSWGWWWWWGRWRDGGNRVVNGAPVDDIFWSYLVKFPDDAVSWKSAPMKNFQDDCILYWWEQHREFIQGSGGSFSKVGFHWIKSENINNIFKSTHPSLVTPSTTLVKFSRTKKNIVRKMCLNCGWVFKSSGFFYMFVLDNVDERCNWEIN